MPFDGKSISTQNKNHASFKLQDNEEGGTLQKNDARRSSTEEDEEEILGEEAKGGCSRPKKMLHDNCSSEELLLDSLDEEEGGSSRRSGSLSVSELLTCDSGVDSEQLTAPNTASIDMAKKVPHTQTVKIQFKRKIRQLKGFL